MKAPSPLPTGRALLDSGPRKSMNRKGRNRQPVPLRYRLTVQFFIL
jgi:hypothetical protein